MSIVLSRIWVVTLCIWSTICYIPNSMSCECIVWNNYWKILHLPFLILSLKSVLYFFYIRECSILGIRFFFDCALFIWRIWIFYLKSLYKSNVVDIYWYFWIFLINFNRRKSESKNDCHLCLVNLFDVDLSFILDKRRCWSGVFKIKDSEGIVRIFQFVIEVFDLVILRNEMFV